MGDTVDLGRVVAGADEVDAWHRLGCYLPVTNPERRRRPPGSGPRSPRGAFPALVRSAAGGSRSPQDVIDYDVYTGSIRVPFTHALEPACLTLVSPDPHRLLPPARPSYWLAPPVYVIRCGQPANWENQA